MTPPNVSRPKLRGVTSSSTMSLTSPVDICTLLSRTLRPYDRQANQLFLDMHDMGFAVCMW